MIGAYGRWAHVGAAWLFAGGVLLQAFLAGAALTQLGGSSDFSAHISFGIRARRIAATGSVA
jgi:hypothetical protein